jgi:hypothetical protein
VVLGLLEHSKLGPTASSGTCIFTDTSSPCPPCFSSLSAQAAYDPISFTSARFCEARVWNLLNPACGGCLEAHLDFAQVRGAARVLLDGGGG